MKNVWNLVFAFLFLLPLVGCEDCNNPNGNNVASEEGLPEPIKLCYKDKITGEAIPLSKDTIEVKGTAQNGELVSTGINIGSIYMGDNVPRLPALFIYDQGYRRFSIDHYYIEFPSLTDTLRIETDTFNAGDCDELKTYRFYYNDLLVFTSDDPTELFFVEK